MLQYLNVSSKNATLQLCTKNEEITFTEEILNGKFNFFCNPKSGFQDCSRTFVTVVFQPYLDNAGGSFFRYIIDNKTLVDWESYLQLYSLIRLL